MRTFHAIWLTACATLVLREFFTSVKITLSYPRNDNGTEQQIKKHIMNHIPESFQKQAEALASESSDKPHPPSSQATNNESSVMPNEPSLSRPFIFFHIPKCAGSTLRNAIDVRAKAMNKTTFFPCRDSIPCPTTEESLSNDSELIKRASCSEVFLGHFKTALVDKLIQYNTESPTCKRSWPANGPKYDCLVAIREPISRTISHYYYFLQKSRPEYNNRRFVDLSTTELRDVIGRSGGNVMLDYLSTSANHDKEKLSAAKEALSKCAVAVVEDWETSSKLIENRFPWLNKAVVAAPRKNSGSDEHESMENLTKEHIRLFEQLLPLEIQLYQEGVEIYEKQLKKLNLAPARNLTVTYDTGVDQADIKNFPFIKAVTYFGRNNPLTFWNSDRFENHIRQDFAQFVAEGFNAIILIIPWAGFQLSVVSPTYDEAYLQRLESVLEVATDFNLFVIARISYPHDFNPENSPSSQQRCELAMVEEKYAPGFKDGWMDYLTMLNGIFTRPKFKNTYLYSYFSWEDFFCLILYHQSQENVRKRLTDQLGFRNFVETKYTLTEVEEIFGKNGSDIIIPMTGQGRPFEVYLDFIEWKWWSLMEQGRHVHPKLTMEVRVDVERITYPNKTRGAKAYDLHTDDIHGPPRQVYWASYMGNRQGMTPVEGAMTMNHILSRTSMNGEFPAILGQFNFLDNTPGLEGKAKFPPDVCGEFLREAAPILKKQTAGYGLWAYRNYRQSEVFNGSFLRGLQGWKSNATDGGDASIQEDGYLLLSGGNKPSSFASVSQMSRQLPEVECDEKNNNMELCFKCRAKVPQSVLEIYWNRIRVHSVNASETWEAQCIRLPALDERVFFPVEFRASGKSAVQIDLVEISCRKSCFLIPLSQQHLRFIIPSSHRNSCCVFFLASDTHNMYIRDPSNKLIPECGSTIPVLNKLLDS